MEKNILLLSMSTFNRTLAESYYAEENGEFRCCGISQLEPGTKYFLRKLQKRERVLDKIFIIESKKSRTEVRNVASMLVDRTSEEINKSAVEFYKERILQYIQGEEKFFYTEPQTQHFRDDIAAYESKMPELKEIYKNKKELFVDIEVKEADIYQSIYELCNKIQELSSEEDTQIHLYLDIQGARRYETFIINSAVKMLEMRGISVKGSSAVDFDFNNNKNNEYNPVVNTTLNDRIFEMVSGMNEFIKTGRGDTLWQFYVKANSLFQLKLEKDIIKQIQKISAAISLCNVEQFDDALNRFAKIVKEYEKQGDEKKNPLFKSFVSDLSRDYEKYQLLSGVGTARILNQIEWCRNKKLYQQALTLVESKMPDAIVDNKILYYRNDKQLTMLLNGMLAQFWSIPSYLLQNKNRVKEVRQGNEKFVFIKYVFDQCGGKDSNGVLAVRGGWNMAEEKMATITDTKKTAVEGIDKICRLMAAYYDLADMRNNTNHASKKNVKMEDLDTVLKDFIELYREICEEKISLDYSKVRPLKKK